MLAGVQTSLDKKKTTKISNFRRYFLKLEINRETNGSLRCQALHILLPTGLWKIGPSTRSHGLSIYVRWRFQIFQDTLKSSSSNCFADSRFCTVTKHDP